MIAKLRALWKKDPGLVVSGGAHVALFVCLVSNFAWPPNVESPAEAVPVEMVSESDLNQVMNGERTAKPLPTPERRVDKVAELEERNPAHPIEDSRKTTPPPPSPEKANDDPGDDDKPTEDAATPPPTPPAPPVPTPPERPVEKTEAPKPPPTPADIKPPPEDAEALEPKPPPRPKTEPKKEPKKVAQVTPAPTPPKRPDMPKPEPKPEPKPKKTLDEVAKFLNANKPPKPPHKQRSGNEVQEAKHSDFSFDKITALIDHDRPQRKASTGRRLTQVASLGLPNAHADKLSPSMKAAIDNWLVDHYLGCWSYFGYEKGYVPVVRVQLGPDGTLIGQPILKNPPSDPNLQSLAQSAVAAVKKCDPLPIPDWFKAHYDAWRDRSVNFDLKEKV